MSRYCPHYCEHGGICELPSGHEGLHDSGYCQWDDAHSLTEDEADALLATKSGGDTYLSIKQTLSPFIGDESL